MVTQLAKVHVIVVSDRIIAGQRADKASPTGVAMLEEAGFEVAETTIVPEGYDAVSHAMAQSLNDDTHLILTCGGTGLGARNLTPEATGDIITTRLEGLERQILLEGLKNSSHAGLSRGIVGLTRRDHRGTLIVNAPSSTGGVKDALTVIISVWPNIAERLGVPGI